MNHFARSNDNAECINLLRVRGDTLNWIITILCFNKYSNLFFIYKRKKTFWKKNETIIFGFISVYVLWIFLSSNFFLSQEENFFCENNKINCCSLNLFKIFHSPEKKSFSSFFDDCFEKYRNNNHLEKIEEMESSF